MCFADAEAGFETAVKAMVAKFKAIDATTDFIFLPVHPTETSDLAGGVEPLVDITQKIARDLGESFFDSFSIFKSWAIGTAAGLYTDVVHLSGAGDRYRNFCLWNNMALGRMPLGQISITGAKTFWDSSTEKSAFGKIGVTSGDLDSQEFYMTRPLEIRATNPGGGLGAANTVLRAWDHTSGRSAAWGMYVDQGIWGWIYAGTDQISINRNTGAGVAKLTSKYPVYAPALRISSSTTAISIIADAQAVVTEALSFIRLTSDSATATDRTFTLNNGAQGQILVLKWTSASFAGELLNTGNVELSADWSPTDNDTLTLIWDSAETKWTELARSANA
jgi:hypothetical protein